MHRVFDVGIDTGGTFTDFYATDGETVLAHKELSTPHAPEIAIVNGLRAMGINGRCRRMVHGSTVATNAILERKGARTVFITNRGFADMLTIGRQARRELYNLTPVPRRPPVPAELCLEVAGRTGADGSTAVPLDDADLERLNIAVTALAPQAVAVNLLFSYLDPDMEQRIAAALPASVFISLSSEILPEYREYERGMATWLNAYVGPPVQRYLARLGASLPAGSHLSVMQSSGVTCDARHAGRRAVNLILSGPAGGLRGAQALAQSADNPRLMTLDMGGTSTDVALVDGDLDLTTEGSIDAYPVAVPMVDVHTIGAGGGSLVTLDPGGLLKVGPESAGADPGPVCYGRGGRTPTVTDAHVVLGRLPDWVALGSSVAVDVSAARAAFERLGRQMQVSAEQAARGALRLANEHMLSALRVISVERGHDPRDFVLVSFGGAGGLHVCELADMLRMSRALVPPHAGMLSACGMLVAAPGRQYSLSVRQPIEALSDAWVNACLDRFRSIGSEELRREGVAVDTLIGTASVDLCYRGQAAALNVPFGGIEAARAAFEAAHARRYGHRLVLPVELVNVRLALKAGHTHAAPPPTGAGDGAQRPVRHTRVAGHAEPVAVFTRSDVPGQGGIAGPAVVVEDGATVWVAPGWQAARSTAGGLRLSRPGL